jgi:alkyl hydroperoxide reductase subunit AhpC
MTPHNNILLSCGLFSNTELSNINQDYNNLIVSQKQQINMLRGRVLTTVVRNCNNKRIPLTIGNQQFLRAFSTQTTHYGTPMIGKPAPDFQKTAVVNGEFKQVKLSDFSGKYFVLFFYPMDFTFVCPTEIIAFNDRLSEFEKIDCAVAAVSTDTQFCHLAWVNTARKDGGLGPTKLPLIADTTKSMARDYGVLIEEAGVALRGLFIIDPKGVLRQITVNDLPVGRSVDEVLRLVQAFQFTDKHGEVCPANWTKGGKTIKPNVKESKEYFSTANKM